LRNFCALVHQLGQTRVVISIALARHNLPQNVQDGNVESVLKENILIHYVLL
jgi:hypothetical protein